MYQAILNVNSSHVTSNEKVNSHTSNEKVNSSNSDLPNKRKISGQLLGIIVIASSHQIFQKI
jgi:hypothetical protein